jgi:hypothetical protein
MYHLFLTAYDGAGLHIINQTPDGFMVVAKHVIVSGRFSWRVWPNGRTSRSSGSNSGRAARAAVGEYP